VLSFREQLRSQVLERVIFWKANVQEEETTGI
jgi:hypothetical protein